MSLAPGRSAGCPTRLSCMWAGLRADCARLHVLRQQGCNGQHAQADAHRGRAASAHHVQHEQRLITRACYSRGQRIAEQCKCISVCVAAGDCGGILHCLLPGWLPAPACVQRACRSACSLHCVVRLHQSRPGRNMNVRCVHAEVSVATLPCRHQAVTAAVALAAAWWSTWSALLQMHTRWEYCKGKLQVWMRSSACQQQAGLLC